MFIKSILASFLFSVVASSAMASDFNFKLACQYPDSKIVNGLQLTVSPSGIEDWKFLNNNHELITKYALTSQYSDYGSIQLGWTHGTFSDLEVTLRIYDSVSGFWSGTIHFGQKQEFEISCKETPAN